MPVRDLSFSKVESFIRHKKFAFVCTADKEGVPHVAGIMYVVSPPDTKFRLYIMTGNTVKKIRNIRENPRVAFGIPFTHHLIRPAPDFCIQFQGSAEILPASDQEAMLAFQQNVMMRKMVSKEVATRSDTVFIKIAPERKIFGFGLGMSIFSLLKNIESGRFSSSIPAERI